jgi:dolichol-phosphate mannosyltransferase
MGLAGGWPPLVDPSVARDFVFVDDVCDAFILTAEEAGGDPGAIYNLGSGRQSTLQDVVEMTRNVLGVRGEPIWSTMPRRSWDTDSWAADCRHIQTALGWQARVDFSDGLRRTIEWLKADSSAREFYRTYASG